MNLCEKYLDIHGFLTIKLQHPKTHRYYSGINFPFEYFEVPSIIEPDITFSIGKFDRKKVKCDIIFRNYEIANKYIYFRRASAGSEYEVEIEMVSENSFVVKFNWIKQRKIDIFLPCYRPQLLILEPLIEYLLLLNGKVLLHAGAITTSKGASIFIGRSGSGKTPIIKSLINQKGARYLGDDKIILYDEFAYAFPKNVCLFDYEMSRNESIKELNTLSEKIRSLIYLLWNKPTKSAYIAEKAKIHSLFLLLRDIDTDSAHITDITETEIYNSMIYNNYAEYWNYYDLWEAFTAYSYYDSKFPFRNYLKLVSSSLTSNITCSRRYKLLIPSYPDISSIKAVANIVSPEVIY